MSGTMQITIDQSLANEVLTYLNERPYGEVRLLVGGLVAAMQARDKAAGAEVIRNAEARGQARAAAEARAAEEPREEPDDDD